MLETSPRQANDIGEHPVSRIDLAAAHRCAVLDGLNEGTWNHLSVVPAGQPDTILVSPAWCHWRQVRASNLVTIQSDGNDVTADGEYDIAAHFIHYPIHAARDDAACVLHVHPPYASALSMLKNERLRMADQNALTVYDRVAYYDSWDGFILNMDHGKRLAEALGDKRVLFLGNHGILVVGPTIAAAYYDLYHLERACMFQCHALATGREIREVDPAHARTVPPILDANNNKERYFAAMKRLLDAEQPDYAQ
jgi:ribulose-5-phosphate 4-epimerase/fuculose-1-phosphate aldolase